MLILAVFGKGRSINYRWGGGQVILSADLGKKRQNASSFHSLLAPSLIKPSPVNKAAGPALYGGID